MDALGRVMKIVLYPYPWWPLENNDYAFQEPLPPKVFIPVVSPLRIRPLDYDSVPDIDSVVIREFTRHRNTSYYYETTPKNISYRI